MKNEIYVIHEVDNDDFSVIGVTDNLTIIDKMLSDYYGEFTVIKEDDVRDSNVVWVREIETPFKKGVLKLSVWVERFVLNEV